MSKQKQSQKPVINHGLSLSGGVLSILSSMVGGGIVALPFAFL